MNIAVGNMFSQHTSAPRQQSVAQDKKFDFGEMLSDLVESTGMLKGARETEEESEAACPDRSKKQYLEYLDKFVKDSEMYEEYFRAMQEGKLRIPKREKLKSNLVRTLEYYEQRKEVGKKIAEALSECE